MALKTHDFLYWKVVVMVMKVRNEQGMNNIVFKLDLESFFL